MENPPPSAPGLSNKPEHNSSKEAPSLLSPDHALAKYPTVAVADFLGKEIKEEGAVVDIAKILELGKKDPAGSSIYFRTVSGNIYNIGRKGDEVALYNGRKATSETLPLKDHPLSHYLNNITIGMPFVTQEGRGTSIVTEVVILDSRTSVGDADLKQFPQNSILKDSSKLMLQALSGKEGKISDETYEALSKLGKELKKLSEAPKYVELYKAIKDGKKEDFYKNAVPLLQDIRNKLNFNKKKFPDVVFPDEGAMLLQILQFTMLGQSDHVKEDAPLVLHKLGVAVKISQMLASNPKNPLTKMLSLFGDKAKRFG